MKDIIIKFLKENDCNNYEIKEYPNGGVKVTVEMEDYPFELCKKAKNEGFYAETFFISSLSTMIKAIRNMRKGGSGWLQFQKCRL